MATNEMTTLRNALVTLLEGDAALQALAGRSSGFVVLWKSGLIFADPTIAMLLPSSTRIGGDGHRRSIAVLFGAYASGNAAQDKAEAMTRRMREILKTTAFRALGVEATVVIADERMVDPETEPETFVQEGRHDLDLLVEMDAPI